jgi:hypothetical protein
MAAQTTLTQFDGVLVTIRTEKSFFEVTKAIESHLQRLSTSRLMEYVTHADRDGWESYVDEVSTPSKFSIFWELEQGLSMRLVAIPIESKFFLVGIRRRRRVNLGSEGRRPRCVQLGGGRCSASARLGARR